MVPVLKMEGRTMPRWLAHGIQMFNSLRRQERSANVVVIWRADDGELVVFHARNFQEVKLWLANEQAGTIH